MKLLTAEQLREMDRRASEDYGVSGLELMERAGLCVAQIAREMLPTDGKALILCGKGNNGGDGLVAARLLHRAGIPVKVWIAAPILSLQGDAKTNYERAVRSGVSLLEVSATPLPPLPPADLLLDALLGTGISSEVREFQCALIAAMNESGVPILSVDVPSGLHSDTGQPRGIAVQADKTVTFVAPKLGLAQHPGSKLSGEVIVADIGMPEPLLEDPSLTIELSTSKRLRDLLPPTDAATNKGARGKLLIIAGSEGMTGAACLAAEAAFRTGSGLVYLACPKSLNDIFEVKLTEVITRPVPEASGHRCFGAESVDAVTDLLEKVDAVVFGPGLSKNEHTAAFFKALLPRINLPMILDADGLNLLSEHPDTKLPKLCVLTPHPGEMARLLGRKTDEIQADRVASTKEAAQKFGGVALLKGQGTVIASPDGNVTINPTGTPALATAGTGDVLSGTIGALLGRKLSPYDAAVAGAYLHGLAGSIAGETFGEEGVLAGDLPQRLPFAFQRVRDPRYFDLREIS